MNLFDSLENIKSLTRANDWRISFVPFIIGCVYLWLFIFRIPFDLNSALLFLLSLTTTIGFASFGYIINEFFDKESDKVGGKVNRLATVSSKKQLALFVISLLLTLAPWLWLPLNNISILLILTELFLFFIYSLPFPRLKAVPYLSGIIDSLYAYAVPLLLSYHTYQLFSGQDNKYFILFFFPAVFLIGYRNIIIHQVNDIFFDMSSGLLTLPQKAGVLKTNLIIVTLLLNEIFFFILASIMLSLHNSLFALWILFYIVFLIVRAIRLKPGFRLQYISIHSFRHISDPAYQVFFPIISFLLLITIDWQWASLAIIHIVLLIPAFVLSETKRYFLFIAGYSQLKIIIPTKHYLSLSINYPIYFLFLIFRIDLRKENKSAIQYLKGLFNK